MYLYRLAKKGIGQMLLLRQSFDGRRPIFFSFLGVLYKYIICYIWSTNAAFTALASVSLDLVSPIPVSIRPYQHPHQHQVCE